MKIKHYAREIIFLHDVFMIPIAWFGAFWLRFNLGIIPDQFLSAAINYLPFVLLIQIVFFFYFSLYGGVWRFSSIPDIIRIIKSVSIGALAITICLFLFNRVESIPRSVPVLYTVLLVLLLSASRFLYRYWKDNYQIKPLGKTALIIGTGSAGARLAKGLLEDNSSEFIPVIFVDDDPWKLKRIIHGIPVGGSIKDIPSLVKKLEIEILLIATPSASNNEMRRIVARCEQCNIPFKTLPSLSELFSRTFSQHSLREVSIEDLLGREPVRLNWDMMKLSLKHKRILITGAGGSIGSELCRQIAVIAPEQLIIFDQSEFNLYKIDSDLAKTFPTVKRSTVLGDVTDPLSVHRLIKTHKPEIIFHAAAYKHVPLLENHVREAIHNNVIGTKIIAEEAIKAGVKRFVLISTDKAVNPGNIMGATKRAAEILCQNLNSPESTRFTTVRFGNVLDSAGSVVPLFREQIKAGGPVTVTDPDITRYFMTIPEACQLIMQAEAAGSGGEIFVLNMGEPVKIAYLAEQMIRLSGKKPGEDIKIVYVGLRPGEKLYEELFHEQENLTRTPYDKLQLAQARTYDRVVWSSLIDELATACQQDDNIKTLSLLKSLVPEFTTEQQNIERTIPTITIPDPLPEKTKTSLKDEVLA